LIRYYEKEFKSAGYTGTVKLVLDGICLFIATASLAVLFTAALLSNTFK